MNNSKALPGGASTASPPDGREVQFGTWSSRRARTRRRFVAATTKELDGWLRRDLRGLALVAVILDGIYIADHVVLIALGFDETGAKHILAVQEGAAENRESCVMGWGN